ncbi:uncharacterized protein LOC107010215 [Solanum pennellii]|uniref:Uncharacterized protein LOC107010215 n=1 Tax=Solanum pennellii TaxID=28526 RepID=A0ABM1G247_SOLPN|nr:uncharacterized protein LOC107010215 [Solanum pennellii]
MIQNNSKESREKLSGVNAQYIKYLKVEYNILQQKTQLHWLKQGDANSKYFHAVIRGRRKKMVVHKVMDENGVWIEGEDNIAKEACDYYQKIFTGNNEKIREEAIQCIPSMITQEQNTELDRMPTEEELRRIIMSMNPNSAPGPDGIGGKFYQVCFDIIKKDIMAAVQSFFNGSVMPRYMTHACLILLPKVEHPNKLKDFRPISLSNFVNKIISKIISTRLASILPKIVSVNQSGFVKGRSITENIMLAQEIVHEIKLPREGRNVVIKLDMSKAYDRVSWSYTCIVLRKMGFSELFIDKMWRIMSNNWYSIVINGKRHGFFQSTRGLKQGDSLSPALFILGAEVLSRQLNLLHHNQLYKGFHMERKGPQINHLSFADDIIIFSSTDNRSLHLIMKTIEEYENVSDQKVNQEKSFFMVTPHTDQNIIDNIKLATGFGRKNSPINYLGCPLYIGGQRIIYYSDIVEKIIKRISGWQFKILNFGGKVTLVKHVLQSIPIHTLATISPPKTTINYIKRVIADFFGGRDNNGKKYHWSSWETMAYPINEGGIGVRMMEDVCKAFQYKQWWEFRTKPSLWSQFLKAKYCQRANCVAKKYDTGDSIVWSLNNRDLASYLEDGKWNERVVRQQVPPLLVHNILQTNITYEEGIADTAIWTPQENGKFSIASAWEIIRKKRQQDPINTIIWHKNMPFKVAFFIWRALRGKLPTNDILQKFGKEDLECYCCYKKGKDDINHILITGHFAKYMWRYYAATVGAVISNINLRSQLLQWRSLHINNEVHKLISYILPNFICWNLWKNRCAVKYGGKQSSIQRVHYGIFKDVMQVTRVVFPSISWQHSWDNLINIMDQCHQQYKVTMVRWKSPTAGKYKLNTDGSALSDSGKIGGGGILRDQQGKLIYAFSVPLGSGTNNMAELKAALYGLDWCEQHGYKCIELEVDSELLCKWIKKILSIPWRCQQLIQDIMHIVSKLEFFQCQHIYREANTTADLLAKFSHNLEIPQHFYITQQLKGTIKESYMLEKMGIQSFRRRKIRRIKHPP